MTYTLASVVKKIEEAKTLEEQVALLKKHSSPALKAIIGYAMDPGVKWLLPAGLPPYKTSEELDNEGRLVRETKKLINFVQSKQGGLKFSNTKREALFINLLEVVHPDDARLMVRVKDKRLTIRPEAAKAAFPTLTKAWK